MKILAKLKRDLAGVSAKMTKLLDIEADRNLTEAESAEFEQLEQSKTELEAKITRREAHIESQRTLDEADDDGVADVGDAKVVTASEARAKDPSLGYRDIGEFASSVYGAFDPSSRNIRDGRLDFVSKFAAASGMNVKSGPDGGFLIPPAFSQKIYDEMQKDSDSLLSRCDVYPVEGESLTFNAIDEKNRATGSRWGGVRAYWLAEADQMKGSSPKFRQVKLEPQGLGVLVYTTDKLLNNAPALTRFLTTSAADEINFAIGDAIINGNGVGKPKGILTSNSVISVAKETSQAADTILAENIDKMTARLHPRAAKNAVWLHNHDCLPQLKNLYYPVKNVAGTENVGGFAPAMFDRKDKTLDGLPTNDCEYCATVGDTGDLILADLSAYAVGIKGGIQSAMSMHLRFDYNETAFRFIFYIDGQPWLETPITPYKGTNTLSTFVKLNAR